MREPANEEAEVAARRTLLCVHPHPDDESIWCGGVLARAVEHGDRAVVVTCTGGEEGENLAGIDLGDEDLPSHRLRELAEALAALGVTESYRLGYRDSGMAGTSTTEHPDSFHAADLDAAARRLAAIIRQVRPDVVVSDDAEGTYGHPDHVKAHRVTVRAVELAADPSADVDGEVWQVAKRYSHTLRRSRLWATHLDLVAAGLASPFGDDEITSVDEVPFGTDDDAVTTVVDVEPWLPAKRSALAAHRTQIGPDSFFLNTPPETAGDLFATEEFRLEAGRLGAVDGRFEDDLFAGLGEQDDEPPTGTPDPAGGVGPDRFRQVLGRFASGVTVMTTLVGDRPHGMTASAVASVSLDPPLVLVCVDRTAVMADEVVAGGVFALSILADDQADLSVRFADGSRPPGEAQFAGVATHVALTGAPILDGAVGWLDATVWKVHDGGDHLIVVGEVVALDQVAERAPLLYHGGGYHGLGPRY